MPTDRIPVQRSRLTRRLAGARISLVTASGGYGKSTLVRLLADELGIAAAVAELGPADTDARALLTRTRAALRARGLSDLAGTLADPTADPGLLTEDLLAALGRESEPVLLAVDDAHHLRDPDSRHVLDALADRLVEPHRLVVLARLVREPLAGIAGDPDVLRLGAEDLAFTTDEIADLLARRGGGHGAHGSPTVAPGAVEGILRASGGWPAAVGLLVDEPDGSAHPAGHEAPAPDHGALLGRLLAERLADLPSGRAALVRQVAVLDRLTPALVAAATQDAGLFDAMVSAGLPLTPAPGGQWRLPDPVRESLAAPRMEPALARRAAAHLEEADEVEAALRVLLGAGLAEDGAARLAALTPHPVERLDLRTMRAIVRAFPAAAMAAHPRGWLHLARACDAAADRTTRTGALDAVEEALASAGPDAPAAAALRRELDAERARDLARDGAADDADALARRVLDATPADEALTRVRALHTMGRVAAWRAEPADLVAAEALLDDVVRLYRDLGMPGWSAHAALSLAYHVHHPRGDADAALRCLDEALGGLGGRQRLRAVLLTFKADILVATGRAADAVAPDDEARAIGRSLGDRRVLAYVAWNEARAASQAGDAPGTLDRLAEVERHPGDWSEHFTGVEFLADAAVVAERVGEDEAAARYLDLARARRAESEQAVLVAEAVNAARSGDPVAAEAGFAALEGSARIETRDRWWLALMRAWAGVRRGDPRAPELAATAFGLSGAIDPGLPYVREPVVADALRDLLHGTREVAPDPPVELRLLGPTELHRGGRPVEVPPGRPSAILEMLGLAGELAIDEVIERLWPETEPETGRARLRNTLNRLREATGPLVERRTEALRLAPAVSVDARRYEADARAALDALRVPGGRGVDARHAASPPDAGAVEAARAAAARYTGSLLPGRPFDDWAAEGREKLARLQLALTDRLAAVAERDGDLDDAIRMRRAGIVLDPDDEARYLALARLLLAQGRRGPALAAIDAGTAALAALGLPPTTALRELRAGIGRLSDGG